MGGEKDNTVDLVLSGSGAAELETRTRVQMLKSAMKKYYLIRDPLFNDLEDKYALETGYGLTEEANLVLVDPSYEICIARGQSSSAHKVFSKRDMEDVVRLLGNIMARGTHGHIFCSDLTFFYCNRSFCAAKKKVGDVKGNLEGREEKLSKAFEIEDQTLLYIEHPGVYNRDLRQRYFFHSSVPEVVIGFWRKRLT